MSYTQDIVNLIQELELLRVAELKKFGSIALIFVFIAFIFFIKFRSNFLPLLGIGFFLLMGSYYYFNSNYKRKVEDTLMPKLILLVDKDFVYNKDEQVDLNLINSFKLFSHEIKNDNINRAVSIKKGAKSAKISSVVFESIKTDTEEGEHESKRFEGAFVVLDIGKSFDQKYLLSKKEGRVDFEAGDRLNPKYAGLKPTSVMIDGLMLFSEDGSSSLDIEIVKHLISLDRDIKALFIDDKIYLFINGVKSSFDISLFSSLKEQNFFDSYAKLLTNIKELIE